MKQEQVIIGAGITIGALAAALLLYQRQNSQANLATAAAPLSSKVSIIISAYNEEANIENTLIDLQSQNIIQQHPEQFEFIVVDNESTDATAEIAAKYATVLSAPRGKLNAMMTGAQAASGDILYFCDADVTLGPNYLNTLLSRFTDPEVVAVSGCPYHWKMPQRLADLAWSVVNSGAVLKVNGASLAIRRDVFFQVGGFNIDIDQFSRHEMQMEEEFGMAAKLKATGEVVVDLDSAFYAQPRLQSCCNQHDSSNPRCAYCKERALGERF